MSSHHLDSDSNLSQWVTEFSILVVLTAIASGLSYLIQDQLYTSHTNDINSYSGYSYDTVRAMRMILFYVLPSLLFVKRWGGSIDNTGVLLSKNYRMTSVLLGIGVYSVAIGVFLHYEIFYGGWVGLDSKVLWIRFLLVAVMASITDFWTRGFILFELSRKFGDKLAIIAQNITWFTIHIYEVELLAPYIGIPLGVALTLFLGFGGDLVALKTKSIVGLMLGHILLNLMVLLAANNYF